MISLKPVHILIGVHEFDDLILFTVSILLITRITGVFTLFSTFKMWLLSGSYVGPLGSTSHRITSTSFNVCSATLTM